jgi:hypothetical protein
MDKLTRDYNADEVTFIRVLESSTPDLVRVAPRRSHDTPMPDILTVEEVETLPQTKTASHPEVHTDVLVI